MVAKPTSVQRSFRLSRTTSDLLDAAADSTGESRNALADRLLGEAIRIERHPLIRFRTGAAGRREPVLVGSRILVRQAINTVKGHGGDVAATAAYLSLPVRSIRAAVAYYAEYTDEVDADHAWATRVAAEERAAWEREQTALA